MCYSFHCFTICSCCGSIRAHKIRALCLFASAYAPPARLGWPITHKLISQLHCLEDSLYIHSYYVERAQCDNPYLNASRSSSSPSAPFIFLDIICKNSLNSMVPLPSWSTSFTMSLSSVSVQITTEEWMWHRNTDLIPRSHKPAGS